MLFSFLQSPLVPSLGLLCSYHIELYLLVSIPVELCGFPHFIGDYRVGFEQNRNSSFSEKCLHSTTGSLLTKLECVVYEVGQSRLQSVIVLVDQTEF